jgi:hypothetical protein
MSAEAKVSCSEVRGCGQPIRGLLVELSSSILLIGKGLEGDESLPPLCCNLSPLCGRQIRLEQGAPRSILAKV